MTAASPNLIYRHRWIYQLAMRAVYGRHYASRYRGVAGLIEPGSSVLDLCCGPGTLYTRYLRAARVDYTGWDIRPGFVAHLVRHGGRGLVCDIRRAGRLPSADYVILQGSLYHFLPDPGPILDRMLAAARRQVILAEPIRNLASSRHTWLAWLARRATLTGTGDLGGRFDEDRLESAVATYHHLREHSFLIPGGRERILVFRGDRGVSRPREQNG